MPVIKKSQSLPTRPVILFVYGDPGVSKTSLGNTSNNPIHLDFDRGIQRSIGRPDSLVFDEGWAEVEREDAAGTFNSYSTLIVDTAKSCLDDFLTEYVIKNDAKLRTNKLKMYGAIGDEFKLFIAKNRGSGRDIVIIAHAKYDKDGDNTKITPDVTGGSLNLLLRIADQVGFMTVENNRRTIEFNPTEKTIGKNVAGLPKLILPLHTDPDWKGFCDREIIQKVKDAIGKQTDDQMKALEILEGWYGRIDALTADDAALKAISTEIGAITETHIAVQVKAYFAKHLGKIEVKWNKEAKVFEPIVAEGVA